MANNGEVTRELLSLILDFHQLHAYDTLLEFLQQRILGIITSKDVLTFESLSENPQRFDLHDLLSVINKLCSTK